jgi:hypothetical protein
MLGLCYMFELEFCVSAMYCGVMTTMTLVYK